MGAKTKRIAVYIRRASDITNRTRVYGTPIEILGVPGFVLHERPRTWRAPSGAWRVSHCATGTLFSDGDTPSKAVLNAEERMRKHGGSDFKKAISKAAARMMRKIRRAEAKTC